MKEIVMSKSCVIDNERLELVLDDLNVFSIEELKDLKRMIMKSYGGKEEVCKKDGDVLFDRYCRIDNNIGRRIFECWKYNKDEDRENNKRRREEYLNNLEEEKESIKEEDDRLNGMGLVI